MAKIELVLVLGMVGPYMDIPIFYRSEKGVRFFRLFRANITM